MKGETMSERRGRRTYNEEFKRQLVELLNHGKPRGWSAPGLCTSW